VTVLTCSTQPAPSSSYALGAAPILTAVYTDPGDGSLVNPSAVIVKVRKPDLTVVTYTNASSPAITNPSTGTFRLVLPATALAGDWFYRFEASGVEVDADETRFFVLASAFTPVVAPTAGRWISAESLLSDHRVKTAKLPPGISHDFIVVAATEELFSATGCRYKTVTVIDARPTQRLWGCGCSGDCGCGSTTSVELPPNSLVLDVKVDGVLLDPSAYKLVNGYRLVRQDGGAFPCCQRDDVPLGQAGTWSVSYTHGELPPNAGVLACRTLAIQMILELGGQESKPPENTESRGRGNARISLNRGKSWEPGRPMQTGIPSVDRWINSVNPDGLRRRSSVTSPDDIDFGVE
jgi:hypothetical protein